MHSTGWFGSGWAGAGCACGRPPGTIRLLGIFKNLLQCDRVGPENHPGLLECRSGSATGVGMVEHVVIRIDGPGTHLGFAVCGGPGILPVDSLLEQRHTGLVR